MKDKRTIAYLHGMSGIVPALIADHDVKAFGEQINDLAFAFIAPLGADYHDRFGHWLKEVLGLWSLGFGLGNENNSFGITRDRLRPRIQDLRPKTPDRNPSRSSCPTDMLINHF